MRSRSGHRGQFRAAAATLDGRSWNENVPHGLASRPHLGLLRLQNGQRLERLVLDVHKVVVEHELLLLVAGAGHELVLLLLLVEGHQLIVLVPVMVVDVLVLEVILQRLGWLVVMVDILGDRVRVLVVAHFQRNVDLDTLSPDSGKRRIAMSFPCHNL